MELSKLFNRRVTPPKSVAVGDVTWIVPSAKVIEFAAKFKTVPLETKNVAPA